MKAIQISRTGGPEVLDLVDLPTPSPGPGEVLVKADAIGVNYFDTMIRTGRYRWMPKLPFVLGNEMSGHVAAVGAGRDLAQGRAEGVHRRLRDRQSRRALCRICRGTGKSGVAAARQRRCRRGDHADQLSARVDPTAPRGAGHHAEDGRGLWRGRWRRHGADRRGAACRRKRDRHGRIGG